MMSAIIGLLSVLGIIVGSVLSVKAKIQHKQKKNPLLLTGISLLLFIGAFSFPSSSPTLEFDNDSVETNEQGIATIEGKTNEKSELNVEGKKVKTKNGTFRYKVTLTDDQEKKVTFTATLGGADEEKTITVTPSKAFVAFFNEEKQEQETIKKAETALALAEDTPTQKNYDEAATLVTSLTQEDLTRRLAIVKENVPIYEAVELAETKQTKEHLDSATALVDKATLNKDSLLRRLTVVQEKITEKEHTESLIAAARTAVEKAEQEPTDEHYNQAITKIKELPNGHTDLSNRANAVKQTLASKKEEAKRVAEAQKKAEEAQAAAEAQQAAAADQTPETPAPDTQGVQEMVLVTPTGSKYHNHKCGNGTYTPDTLESAKARGLTACSKCY
ncbi:hypothetical protein [Enterococcus termitis]|nr:hypothetical protein [Enterococcus termitis]